MKCLELSLFFKNLHASYYNRNNIFSLLFRSLASSSVRRPKSPFTKVLSNVAILLVLINDCFLSPFDNVAKSCTSVGSCHCNCVVIKQAVTSSSVSASTTAGLILLPLKVSKGKSNKYDISFIHYKLLLSQLMNKFLPHYLRNQMPGFQKSFFEFPLLVPVLRNV